MDVRERVLGRITGWWGRRGGVAQFHQPTGLGGRVAGYLMSTRPSNVARGEWAVRLLDVRPGERVLELGCGPGVALAAVAARTGNGLAVGVDHSGVMIGQARRRNRAAIRAGRVRLVESPVQHLATALADGERFDAALAINTAGMWPDPPARLREIVRLLRPGGRIALVSQPRRPGATTATTRAVAGDLAALLTGAGAEHVRTELLDLDPPVAFVLAQVR